MKHLNSLIIATFVISTLLISCDEDDPQIKITSISFNTASVEVIEGASVNLDDHLTIEGEDADKAQITFSSTDEEVVTVNGNTLTAASVGQTTVEATETNTNQSATIEVTVIADNISVTGVSLDKESISLEIGQTTQLTATIAPDNATNKSLTWSVEFPSGSKTKEELPTAIATVSEEGLVTAVSPGEVVIVVTTADGEFTAKTDVTVTGIPVTSVTLDKETADLDVGSTLELNATVLPSNATEKGLTWSVGFPSAGKSEESNPEDIATVSEDGVVSGVSAGTVEITAETKNGLKASTIVSVNNIPVTSITVDPNPIEVNVNESVQLTATVAPENATIKTITWSVALVEAAGRILVAAPAVDTYLEINEDGLLTAKQRCDGCTFTVTASAEDSQVDEVVNVSIKYIPVTNIILNPSSLFSIHQGQIYQMDYTVVPSNATDPTITWDISHSGGADLCGQSSINYESYAKVDANGVITAINPYFDDCDYNLVVQASSSDLSSPVGTEFDVTVPVTSLTINTAAGGPVTGSIDMPDCSSYQLGVTVGPVNASDKTVTWSSSNTDVLTVDSTGKLSLKLGLPVPTNTTVKVKVTANDGSGASDEVDVLVTYNGC